MNVPTHLLTKLAEKAAATWTAMATEAFRGDARIETSNTVYRFRDGLFASCAPKHASSFVESEALRGLRLIGFLAYADGLWSLSPRWRQGALAVFWRGGKDERSFIVTSATSAFSLRAPAPKIMAPLRAPAPPSMTRLLSAAAPAAVLR